MPYMRGFITINSCMFNNYLCACAYIVVAEICSFFQYVFDDGFAYCRAIESEIKKTWLCDGDLFDSGIMYLAQHIGQLLCDWQWLTAQLVLAGPWHDWHRIVTKAALGRKSQVNRQLFNIERYLLSCKIGFGSLFNQVDKIFIYICC